MSALRLRAGLAATVPHQVDAGTRIGAARQERKHPIALVAFGIGAISDALGELGGKAGVSFAAGEYQCFNQVIDESTAAAIEEYEKRSQEEQHKRETKRLGFLAHQMRNALGSARMAYAAIKSGVIAVNSQTGQVLGRSLTTMEHLVADTLAAVHLEAGVPVDRRPVHLDAFCRRLEADASPERGVTIRLDLQEGVVVHGDERLLASIVSNLLQNALKFTRRDGVVVLRTRLHGSLAVVEVEDECGGLPEGKEQTLLMPFVQQGADRRGLGLGLAIAHEAAEAHGGRLRIRNLPGRGCVFGLEVPAP